MKASRLLWAALACAAAIIALYIGASVYFTSEETRRAQGRLLLYRATLVNALDRFQHLPFVIAQYPLAQVGAQTHDHTRLNEALEEIAQRAGVDVIYLMNAQGQTIAASDHRAPNSFIGHSYGFRGYFKDALTKGYGAQYAVGATTGRPGYFIAQRVTAPNGEVAGVLVAKIDLGALQRAWRDGGETVFVSNAEGVVALSSDPSRLYRVLRPMSAAQRARIAQRRQFGQAAFLPLDWRVSQKGYAVLEGEAHIHVSTQMPGVGWTLHYLAAQSRVTERALFATVIGAVVLISLLAAAAFIRSERLKAMLQATQAQRRALHRSNMALSSEITERIAAQARLTQAKSELERASKMAALGQLAASVTHELGQPIAAMRNYLAAAEMECAPAERDATLRRLGGIAARMERIVRELKFFAHPGERRRDKVDLSAVIDGATLLMSPDLKAQGVAFEANICADALYVSGDKDKLERVLVNLMRNGVSASEAAPERGLFIEVRANAGHLLVSVRDTGGGIGEHTIEELQSPFHTTKASGEGMGLGLAIAAQIMREHGGALRAANHPQGGAVFTLELPLYQEEPV